MLINGIEMLATRSDLLDRMVTINLPIITEEIYRTLQILFPQPNPVVELRLLKVEGRDNRVDSGYFDNLKELAKFATQYEGRAQGVYVTINQVMDDLLARRYNRVKEYVGESDTTKDDHITNRLWLPFDLDPTRPTGISSNDQEHILALSKAKELKKWLSSLGWHEPIDADSGNGGHLLYKIDLPNNTESKELISKILNKAHDKIGTEKVKVDVGVFNAARIWKLYGTMSAKGDNLPFRPHRRSKILEMPNQVQLIEKERLLEFVGDYEKNTFEVKKPAKVQSSDFVEYDFTPNSKQDPRRWIENYQFKKVSKSPNNSIMVVA